MAEFSFKKRAKGPLREIRDRAAATGADPLDVMFETMRDLMKSAKRVGITREERLELKERASAVARGAAPYLYPRQRYIEVEERSPLDVADAILGRMTEDEIYEQLTRRREKRMAQAQVVEAKELTNGARNWRVLD